MNWRTRQSPETWGTLSDEEWALAQQFGQSLSWDEYQSKRHLFKKEPDLNAELKKALDAMAVTFSAPVFEQTAVWHWAWEYRGEKPPVPKPLFEPSEYFNDEDDGA